MSWQDFPSLHISNKIHLHPGPRPRLTAQVLVSSLSTGRGVLALEVGVVWLFLSPPSRLRPSPQPGPACLWWRTISVPSWGRLVCPLLGWGSCCGRRFDSASDRSLDHRLPPLVAEQRGGKGWEADIWMHAGGSCGCLPGRTGACLTHVPVTQHLLGAEHCARLWRHSK